MHTKTAAQKAPRALQPSPARVASESVGPCEPARAPEQKKPEVETTTHTDDRESLHDDDLYGNLAHTD